MMSEKRRTHARENSAPSHVVLTNNDLLTEILIRLPILCIHLFTIVSTQWLRILTSHVFPLIRSKITKVDHPVGRFVNHIRSSFHCDFVSLDPRIKSRKYTIDKSFISGSTEAVDNVNILQSCNGLLIAIYWNNALHWLETENMQLTHYKLNIEDHEHPIITTIQIPQGLQQGRNFFESYGNMLPMIITIQIPHMLHLEGKLFESRGCLLLDGRFGPLGEREENFFLVINLSGKVVEYNLILKTLCEIYDMRSNQVADDYLDGFIPPFVMYDMRSKKVNHKVYEFIPSSASV
ncbi:hypothetical protein Tco_0217777 [Tanacetum coccineum]